MDIIPTKLLVVARTVATICLPVGAIFCPAYTNVAADIAVYIIDNSIISKLNIFVSPSGLYGFNISVNSPRKIDSNMVDTIDVSENISNKTSNKYIAPLANIAPGSTAIQRRTVISVLFFILSSYSK